MPRPRAEPAGATWLLAVCGGAWGSSLLFISQALDAFDPLVIGLLRNLISAVALSAWLWWAGPRVPRAVVRDLVRRPGLAVAAGVTGFAGPMLLVSIAAQHLPTGLVAVVLASSPLLVALVAVWLAPGDQIGRRGTAGIAVGLVGVVLAVGGNGVAAPGELGYLFLPLGAASLTAVYPMVMRRGYPGVPPVAIVAHATAGGAVVSLLLLPLAAMPTHVTPRAAGAVLVLGLLCTAAPFALHARLVERLGSVRAGTANYFIPVTGLLLGVTLLGESLRATAPVGLVLILGGVRVAGSSRPASETDAPETTKAPVSRGLR